MDKTIAIAGKPRSEPTTTSPKRRNLALGKMALMGWLFLLPTFVLMMYTSFIPAIWNLILSFQKSTLFTSQFVGVANYINAFQDSVFPTSLWHSILIAVVTLSPPAYQGGPDYVPATGPAPLTPPGYVASGQVPGF